MALWLIRYHPEIGEEVPHVRFGATGRVDEVSFEATGSKVSHAESVLELPSDMVA